MTTKSSKDIGDRIFDPQGRVPKGLRDRQLEEQIMRNPAGLTAALGGDMRNAIIAGEPGGIEAQEKAGQESFVSSDRLPIRGLNERGMKDYLIGQGFVFGEPLRGQDAIFIQCKLAPGWEKRASDHSMWSYLHDPQGRQRASIFFKAAFYDYDAHISFSPRYSYKKLYCNAAGDEVDYNEHTHLQFALTDCGKALERVGDLVESFSRAPDEDRRRLIDLEDTQNKLAQDVLERRFPEAKDPRAYWEAVSETA